MRWSYKCGKVLGIDLYAHVTFFLLLAYFLFDGLVKTHNFLVAGLEVGLVVFTFAIVVMHELGHALAARHFGIATRRIMLLPIGGVASLERMPEKPKEELIVALAGPCVNLALAFIFGLIHFLCFGVSFHLGWGDISVLTQFLLHWAIMLNLCLLGFNLVPAFPMDGGRVLRALLGFKYDYLRATEIAVKVAHLVAVCLFVYALIAHRFLLMLIALFVWRGGSSELNMLRGREMMRRMHEQYGRGGQDLSQGIELPNGERVIMVPGAMGWRVVRVAVNTLGKEHQTRFDADTINRNYVQAQMRADRQEEEPRARIIDVH